MDVDDIPLGVDFTRYIDEKVGQCEVLLAVIGRDWLNATDEEGKRRLEQPGDYVRIELESALKRKIPVIPLLVRRASMPEADELPGSIRDFAKRNGMQVRADPDFRTDCDRLIEGLERDRTGKRPIISTRNKRVVKKPRGRHKALIIGALGIAVVSALIGFYTWFASRPGPAPSIVEFQADPNRIEQGSTTTLKWVTKHTKKVSIQPNIGTVAVSGSKVIRPRENTTYTLVATGSDNRHAKQRLSIQVNSQPVATIPVSRLSVAENTIELGKSTTLSWRTRDATEVEIKPGIGSVEANGSIEISPRRNTTYTLTAKSPAGTATSNILVRVERIVPRTIITRPAIR